ncbi:MAG: 3-oxoacyl-ACP reductase FabG [Leptospiraceae bacterium]|nr:3-oxoacyl-ACP reductase FabG [Leptospiraceae bacterium]MDW7974965.1 3-oxoacyl-ACP reductase FabG [Leptospiraceae bacterium]
MVTIDLKDKTAIITGSARGIGKAIAEKLAQAGAKVVINDILEEQAKQTAEEIANKYQVETLYFACDISKEEEANKLIELCKEKWGKVDILVNNAGITRDTLLLRMTKEQWDQVINVNLTGTFLCTKAAFKVMMNQRSGVIINISSIAGENGNIGQANYSASKAGVIGLTKTVAMEGAARGVRCNAIAPGFIQTAMTDAIPEKIKQKMIDSIPLRRPGMPEDIANAVLFLVSDLASYITGIVLDVNGGGFRP